MPPYVHPAARVETNCLGDGTRVWAFAHVMPGAEIGRDCNIGGHAFIETGAVLGDNVTLKNHVCVWEGIRVEDDVFIGPQVTFVNDRYPRSPRMREVRERYANKDAWLVETVLEQGCSVGANATLLGGLRLGRYSMIAAGATVTQDVEPFALMAGTPARRIGTVCLCGRRLTEPVESHACPECAGSARHERTEHSPSSI